MKGKRAQLFLLATAIIWGFGFIGTNNALEEGITVFQLICFRFLFASILMSIIFFKELIKIDKETLIAGIIIGIPLYIAFIVQTFGLLYTTIPKSAFLTATNVVIVPFIYWMVSKVKPDNYSFAGAFLTLIGIGFLSLSDFTKESSTVNIGDLLTLLSALFYAIHIFITSQYSKKHSPIQLTIIQLGAAGLIGLFFVLIERAPISNLYASKMAVGSLLYLAIVSSAIAYLFQNIGQKYTEPTTAAIILSLESLFGTIAAIIFLGDSLTMPIVIGFVFIFIAVIITETKLDFLKKKKNEEEIPND